jgi:hypothetical protein
MVITKRNKLDFYLLTTGTFCRIKLWLHRIILHSFTI